MTDQRPMPRRDAIENLVIEQMRSDLRASRRRHFRLPTWSILTTAAAAVAAIVAVTVSLVMSPTTSYAATPPMLAITQADPGTDTDAARLLNELAATRRGSVDPDPVAPGEPQRINMQTWSLVTNPDGDQPTYVAPEHVAIARYPDGAWQQIVTAGPPYDVHGDAVEDPSLPAPGTELWRMDEKAGEHIYVYPDVLPTTGPELAEVMRAIGFSDESSPNEWMSQVNSLLTERVPTPAEEAAVLEVLSTVDLRYAGTTVDRLGRDAYVFETPPSDVDLVDRVLVSPTGRIVAMETIYVGDDRTDIPSPAVVGYYAWEGRS